VYDAAALIIGTGLIFGIPAWAAWVTFPKHRMFAVATVVQLTAVWCGLCIWLAAH
jgi:hypothetical protein